MLSVLTDLLKAGREFLAAVASLKELLLAIAVITGSVAVMTHPADLKDLIAIYVAGGRGESD